MDSGGLGALLDARLHGAQLLSGVHHGAPQLCRLALAVRKLRGQALNFSVFLCEHGRVLRALLLCAHGKRLQRGAQALRLALRRSNRSLSLLLLLLELGDHCALLLRALRGKLLAGFVQKHLVLLLRVCELSRRLGLCVAEAGP